MEDEDTDASRNAIQQLLLTIQKAEANGQKGEGENGEGEKMEGETTKEVTEEMVSESLAYAEKVARELNEEEIEFEDEIVFEKGEGGGEQITFEKEGGKKEGKEGTGEESVVYEKVEMHKEDDGFVMV